MLTNHDAKIVWIIGLPNAGKTVVAQALHDSLKRVGKAALLLDGDDIRKVLGMTDSHYDRESRVENALRIGRLAQVAQSQGLWVIVSANTFFHEVQRCHREQLHGYFEVYLRADEAVRRARDGDKKLYQRFDEGAVRNVLGLDIEAEEPEHPDVVLVNTQDTELQSLLNSLLRALKIESGASDCAS